MPEVYRAADLCVCRAGAMTVAELLVRGVPAILVPLPGAPRDHQTRNAEALVAAGAAILIPDAECTAERLEAEVGALLCDRDRLAAMAAAARGAGPPRRRSQGGPVGGRACPLTERDVLDLRSPRRVHIVGIGGAGMSAIATVLRSMGHTVSGSDLKESPVAVRLRAQGIAVAVGHRAENVGDVDAVTFSPAVPPTQSRNSCGGGPGRRSSWPVRACWPPSAPPGGALAVAGTKGKTTTASMLSLILIEAGLRPSFLIGADVNEVGTNAVWDTGEWLVVEADESFGTFQELRPAWAVLTNVASDHLDHYGTFPRLRAAFDAFVGAGLGGLGGFGGRRRGRRHRTRARVPQRRHGRRSHLRHDRYSRCTAARRPSRSPGPMAYPRR